MRGGLLVRLASLFFGLFLFAVGIVAQLESGLGLPPWDVLHQGLDENLPISFGVANILVGVVVLAAAAALGARVGFGTLANATAVGLFIELLLRTEAVHTVAGWSLAARLAVVVAGVMLMGIGSAFYIGAALGAGPRDSLMLVCSRRTGIRVGAVRATIELTALAAGWLLGGTVGVGTVAFALLIGPSVELAFGALRRSPLARSPAPAPARA